MTSRAFAAATLLAAFACWNGAPGAAAAPAAAGASIGRLAELIVELEASMDPDAKIHTWGMFHRRKWASRLKGSEDAAGLKRGLKALAEAIEPGGTLGGWVKDRRSVWLSALDAAATPADVAAAVLELEQWTRDPANAGWRARREAWLAEVKAASGAAAAAAPAPEDEAPAGAGQGRLVRKLGRLLLELEAATLPESHGKAWKRRRPAWVKAVRRASTIRDLGGQVLALAGSFTRSSFDAARLGRRPRPAATVEALVDQLLAVGGGVAPEMMDDAWPGRRDAWKTSVESVR